MRHPLDASACSTSSLPPLPHATLPNDFRRPPSSVPSFDLCSIHADSIHIPFARSMLPAHTRSQPVKRHLSWGEGSDRLFRSRCDLAAYPLYLRPAPLLFPRPLEPMPLVRSCVLFRLDGDLRRACNCITSVYAITLPRLACEISLIWKFGRPLPARDDGSRPRSARPAGKTPLRRCTALSGQCRHLPVTPARLRRADSADRGNGFAARSTLR